MGDEQKQDQREDQVAKDDLEVKEHQADEVKGGGIKHGKPDKGPQRPQHGN